ncbi:helix-turn-helix transcriptional regulator [Streptomyces sp. MNU89]|uniref:ArsR/SmtB family transcription factor n=1 Tax=Streptomyces sp. MNU89 TaxID=2560025 RepID=UPI001E65C5EE|nr:winged helix-turn-helix domain-containing protein [Streptomyces sp. MNU89]MCC9738116.1 winged helix-turn-helix domain-containing protein [Streptomyces sp. MNU89]
MPLRFHFTAEDLARTRVAEAPRPLLELDIALRLLQERTYPVRFGAWRKEALRRLSPRVRMLFEVTPSVGASLDLLGSATVGDPRELFEEIRSLPRGHVRKETEAWAVQRRTIPSWTRALGEDPDVLRQLVDLMEHVHREAVAPHRERVDALAAADRAVRMRHAARGGRGALLNSLNPRRIRWEPPVLAVTMASGRDADVHLGGRGLLLIPSLFGVEFPALEDTAEPQPWITYPLSGAETGLVLSPAAPAAPSPALSALLGATRATVLRSIAEHPGCTTTELARHAGISPASASEHATVLRTAGLTTTTRHRNTALHTVTPAGVTLLNAPAGR